MNQDVEHSLAGVCASSCCLRWMLASHLLGEEAVWRPRAWALVQYLLRCSLAATEQFDDSQSCTDW